MGTVLNLPGIQFLKELGEVQFASLTKHLASRLLKGVALSFHPVFQHACVLSMSIGGESVNGKWIVAGSTGFSRWLGGCHGVNGQIWLVLMEMRSGCWRGDC